MLHGLLHSSVVWGDIVQILSDRYEFVTPDWPGFGTKKDFTIKSNTIEGYTEILDKWLSKEKYKFIVADSLGALIVLNLLKKKYLADGIILTGCPINGLPFYFHFPGVGKIIELSIRKFSIFPVWFSNLLLNISLSTIMYKPKGKKSIIKSCILNANPESTRYLFNAIKQLKINYEDIDRSNYKEILFVRGQHDKITKQTDLIELSTKLRVKYKEITRCGHSPMLESPRQFSLLLCNTFDRIIENANYDRKD